VASGLAGGLNAEELVRGPTEGLARGTLARLLELLARELLELLTIGLLARGPLPREPLARGLPLEPLTRGLLARRLLVRGLAKGLAGASSDGVCSSRVGVCCFQCC